MHPGGIEEEANEESSEEEELKAGDLMIPDKPKVKKQSRTMVLLHPSENLSHPSIEARFAHDSQTLDLKVYMEEIIEDLIDRACMEAESANQFDEAKRIAEEMLDKGLLAAEEDRLHGGNTMRRRKVLKNNMDYLMTMVEERGMLAERGTDIRYSVKESYRRFFNRADDPPEENKELFEIAPALNVRGGDASK